MIEFSPFTSASSSRKNYLLDFSEYKALKGNFKKLKIEKEGG